MADDLTSALKTIIHVTPVVFKYNKIESWRKNSEDWLCCHLNSTK